MGVAINIETEKEFPTAGGIGSTHGLVQYETVSLSNVTKVRLEMLEYCFLMMPNALTWLTLQLCTVIEFHNDKVAKILTLTSVAHSLWVLTSLIWQSIKA